MEIYQLDSHIYYMIHILKYGHTAYNPKGNIDISEEDCIEITN